MHNPFPASANITPPELIAFFIYWALQSFCSFLSIEKIRMLILVKAITITPTFLILLVWAVTVTKGGGKLVNGPTEMTYEYGAGWAWVSGICHVAGLFSTLSVNMPDFGRYSRDERGGTSQVWAFPLLGSLAAVTPIFVTSAGQELWGELIWDFPTLLHKFDSRTAKFFVAAAFVLATLGNQLGADCIPFANDSMALAPRYINRFRANTFAAVVCVISTPWNIIRSGQGFITFLLGYASYTSCLAAIMVADFFVVKRQKVDVCELYKPYGLYWYTHGWNWRAYVAFFVGFIPSVPGFAKSIDDSLNIGTAWVPFQMAWIFGTVVSFTTYILVNLVWPDPARVYEAVKPHEIFAQRRRARAAEKARRKLLEQQQQEQQQQESATVDFDARSMSKGSMPTTPGDGLAAAEGSSTINGAADASTGSNPYFVNALTSHDGSGEDLRTVEKEIIELYETDRRHPQHQIRNSPPGPHHNSSKVE